MTQCQSKAGYTVIPNLDATTPQGVMLERVDDLCGDATANFFPYNDSIRVVLPCTLQSVALDLKHLV